MGIPYLIKRLQPFAISSMLGSKHPTCTANAEPNSDDINSAVIDGPSLAYFIYYRLLAHKSASLSQIDAVPSYAEIGRGVLAFLEQLEHCGLCVYADMYLLCEDCS